MPKVGVIGLGQMGRGIAANLDRAGYLVAAWDVALPTRDASGLVAIMLPPVGMAAMADIVLFAVPSSRQIAACLDDMLPVTKPGQILVDLTTSDPVDTKRLAARAAESGRHYVDAGMSGGGTGADAGTLTLMLGGDPAAIECCVDMFKVIASRVVHLGPAGAGHTMKLVHNMVCHTNFLALVEACRMAERAGIALPEAIAVINAGNARSYVSERRFPDHVLTGRFDGRSRVSNLAKDLGMAAAMAEQLGQASPYTHLTADLLARALADGRADDDFTTLFGAYDQLAEPG